MSELNHQPTPDTLDQATAAIRDATVPAGPPADVTAATLAAIDSRLTLSRPALRRPKSGESGCFVTSDTVQRRPRRSD